MGTHCPVHAETPASRSDSASLGWSLGSFSEICLGIAPRQVLKALSKDPDARFQELTLRSEGSCDLGMLPEIIFNLCAHLRILSSLRKISLLVGVHDT